MTGNGEEGPPILDESIGWRKVAQILNQELTRMQVIITALIIMSGYWQDDTVDIPSDVLEIAAKKELVIRKDDNGITLHVKW